MFNNKIISLVYKSILLGLCIVANYEFLVFINGNTLMYFTVLSNIFVFVMTLLVWLKTLKSVAYQKQYEGYNENYLLPKGIATLVITVTFLVYAFLLADYGDKSNYAVGNILKHYAIPVMFILDYFFFDKKGAVRWYTPLIWIGTALTYLPYVFIRAAILGKDTKLIRYPYFFLNVDELGAGKVAVWCVILVIVFSIIGYLYYIFDYFYSKKKNNNNVDEASDITVASK